MYHQWCINNGHCCSTSGTDNDIIIYKTRSVVFMHLNTVNSRNKDIHEVYMYIYIYISHTHLVNSAESPAAELPARRGRHSRELGRAAVRHQKGGAASCNEIH